MESGLTQLGAPAEALMDIVFTWTNGHPALTQVLCEQLVRQGETPERAEDRVYSIVRERFMDAKRRDGIALDIEEHLLAGDDTARTAVLVCWEQLRTESVHYDVHNPAHERILMSGIARLRGEALVPRNAIFQNVFDQAWIEKMRGNLGEDAETVEDSLREKT